jgi:hypothetical protein
MPCPGGCDAGLWIGGTPDTNPHLYETGGGVNVDTGEKVRTFACRECGALWSDQNLWPGDALRFGVKQSSANEGGIP